MRYIRFLKTPRIVHEKNSSRAHISCLITITSDLGDSFLPYEVTLATELLYIEEQDVPKDEMSKKISRDEKVFLRKSFKWTSRLRTLPISLPLSKSHASWPLRVRIGVDSKSTGDDFGELVQEERWRGVVSAWSGIINATENAMEAEKFVERRFDVGENEPLCVLEETGESIARHLWDAGITLSCHIKDIISQNLPNHPVQVQDGIKRFQVIELGTGCGIVGLTLAKTIPNSDVILTDLLEAREIVQRNIELTAPSLQGSVVFEELDWDSYLPESIGKQVDLIVAADCTYNPDSSPSLVRTIGNIARTSPSVVVMIAMKRRHSSEEIFFDLMTEAKFVTTRTLTYALPGDEQAGEEEVEVYLYRYEETTGLEVEKSAKPGNLLRS